MLILSKFLKKCVRLYLLITFSRNFLQQFPLELCQLQKLRSLSINNNRIETIPEEIGKLKELHSLVSVSLVQPSVMCWHLRTCLMFSLPLHVPCMIVYKHWYSLFSFSTLWDKESESEPYSIILFDFNYNILSIYKIDCLLFTCIRATVLFFAIVLVLIKQFEWIG